MTETPLDLVGIGAGPFNLALAALLDGEPGLQTRFFERSAAFEWHPGMLLSGAKLQTSCLKDLVTAVAPTSPHSFLAYLVAHGRFYQHLTAELDSVDRREFADYLRWVAERVPSVAFGQPVHEVTATAEGFRVHLDSTSVSTRQLCVATGRCPIIPEWMEALPRERAYHNAEYLLRELPADVHRVAVIGGGQSGAEVVLDLLARTDTKLTEIAWLSSRKNFVPLDDTPFTNELFTPAWVETFHALPEHQRDHLLATHHLAGDGISAPTLRELYQTLYRRRHFDVQGANASLLPGREVFAAERMGRQLRLFARNRLTGTHDHKEVDAVIVCTGYRSVLPSCLAPIAAHIARDSYGRPQVGANFRAHWTGPGEGRLYLQNLSEHSHGIAEPQLSLMAWRAGVIANAVLGKQRFPTTTKPELVHWGEQTPDDWTLQRATNY